ncbi:uncharacterized protein RJT20DRAFT_64369 [Scheffersomyces xylosifermentans]|uniref:uncharacterized protein n=1 Tax=Scheffersomyces xylosifermentans TaxID=1304137 RepID=UPI00315D7267
MLLKPVNEYRAPRHTLEEDEFEDAKPAPIPTIALEWTEAIKSVDFVVVAPSTISILSESLPQQKIVGTIRVSYPQLYSDTEQSEQAEKDDYDEDEQLYSAIQEKVVKSKYPTTNIPIHLGQNGNSSAITVTLPHFANVITHGLVARKLVQILDPLVKKSWVTLAPCGLNNNQTLNKMVANSGENIKKHTELYDAIPTLKPPHFITGISASVVSQLNLVENPKLLALVLNSEGQSGFEKSDNDALVDAGVVLGDVLGLSDKNAYLKKISLAVRKFNGFSNSGMYV